MSDRRTQPPPAPPPPTLADALDRHRAGDAAGAAAAYRAVLAQRPGDANLWRLLGLALRQTGADAAALAALEKAHLLAPDDPTVAADRGVALCETGAHAAALAVLLPAAERLAEPAALAALADALAATDRPGEAVGFYRRSLAADPDNAAVLANLGAALHRTGDFAAAAAACEAALARAPRSLDALTNFGLALLELGRAEDAMAPLLEAARRAPREARSHTNLGAVYRRRGRHEDARHCFEAAVAADPADAAAWSSLGTALLDDGRPADALAAHDRAAALAPQDADVQWNRAVALLLAGHWAEGFAACEWRVRTRRHAPRRHSLPHWQGGPPAGRRILLQAEQGFGDTIQFARYAPLLAARGARVTVACAPRLVPLLATLPGIAAAVDETGEMPPADAYQWLMSLPRLFATTPETVPADVPYLRVPPGARQPPARTVRPRIGLAWTGNPAHPDNPRRTCPPAALAPLFAAPGVEWISLQYRADATAVSPRLADWSPWLEGFADTAAAVAALDLVVSVDTATAHLAGALGQPVWLMLAHAPDWRWMLDRTDTPWYPTMRLYRQPRPGDWGAVVATVAADLARTFPTRPEEPC